MKGMRLVLGFVLSSIRAKKYPNSRSWLATAIVDGILKYRTNNILMCGMWIANTTVEGMLNHCTNNIVKVRNVDSKHNVCF